MRDESALCRPNALRRGDTIGLIALADGDGALFQGRTRRAIGALREMGFEVAEGNVFADPVGGLAGTPLKRAEAFNNLVRDERVRAILSVVGGNDTHNVLEHIDFAHLAACPKILMGYSDFSTLLLAAIHCSAIVCFHGPALLPQFGEFGGLHPYSRRAFDNSLMVGSGGPVAYPDVEIDEFLLWDHEDNRPRQARQTQLPQAVSNGETSGRLLIANINSLDVLVDTPFLPDLEGAILGIDAAEEETGASFARKIDRLMAVESFSRVSAVMLGRLVANGHHQVIHDHFVARFQKWRKPVALGLPFGHVDPQNIFPLGVAATLECNEQGVALQLAASGVSQSGANRPLSWGKPASKSGR